MGTYDWDIVAGQLSLEAELADDSRHFFQKIQTSFQLPSSYVASIEVSQTTSDGVACGLILEHDIDPYYGFYFLVDSSNQQYGVWGPQSREDFTRESVVAPTFDSGIRKGDMNQIELVAEGETLAFTVNGETLAQLTRSGFATLSGIGPAAVVEPGDEEECRFDNYSVVESD